MKVIPVSIALPNSVEKKMRVSIPQESGKETKEEKDICRYINSEAKDC